MRNLRKYKKLYIPALLAMVLISGFVFTFSFYGKSHAATNTAPSGVTVQGMDVSGMNAEEVQAVIDAYVASFQDATFTLSAGPKSITASAVELGLTSKNQDLANQVVSYGSYGNPAEQFIRQKSLEKNGKDFSISLSVDKDVLTEYLSARSGELVVEAKNYGLTRVDGQFVMTDGQEGTTVIVDQSVSSIASYMNTDWQGGDAVIELATQVVEPAGNKETLSQVQDLLGTFTTDYSPADTARGTNVERASSIMNETIVYPGETVSFYERITPLTAENGYEAAGAYVNGEVVQEEGGGVCQVSSTAYNAILAAELEIETRAAHSMTVKYVELSMDAAIAGESDGSNYLKDLQFTNNKEYPVFLEFICSGGELTVNVYGKETRPENRVVTYENEITEVIPYTTTFVADPTQMVGVVSRSSSGTTGYKARLWKVVTVDGVEESRTRQNQSSYNMKGAVYVVGTASADPAATEAVNAAILSGDPNAVYAAVYQYSGVAPSIAVDTKGINQLMSLSGASAATTTTETPAATETPVQ